MFRSRQSRSTGRRASVAVACCAGVMIAVSGCGSSETLPFEQFERLPTSESLVSIPLGEFVVPIPLKKASIEENKQVQIEFHLYAAVIPKFEKRFLKEFPLFEGRLRDSVIDACRNTTYEDLFDPALVTLKVHLTDTIQPYFGRAPIERIHIADVQIKPL